MSSKWNLTSTCQYLWGYTLGEFYLKIYLAILSTPWCLASTIVHICPCYPSSIILFTLIYYQKLQQYYNMNIFDKKKEVYKCCIIFLNLSCTTYNIKKNLTRLSFFFLNNNIVPTYSSENYIICPLVYIF